MSALWSISHHLFVAAAGQDDRVGHNPLPQGSGSAALDNSAPELPLEMLEASQQLPAGVSRSLRTPETSARR
jgi:hypothetical protein